MPGVGRRPFLILTRESAIPVLRRIIGVPATRTIRGAVTEVGLDKDDGMPSECVLTLDNIRIVEKDYLREKITSLSAERMREVCRALSIATGCD